MTMMSFPEHVDLEESEEYSYRGVAGTIILINIHDPLSKKFPEAAHVATCRAIKQCLRTSTNQNIGVVLYGIDDPTLNNKNVLEVIPLAPPNLTDYKKLKNINVTGLQQAKVLKLSEALWCCNKMFNSCTKILSSQTIILLSRLDTPPTSEDETPTFDRIVELNNAEIDLKIINVSKSEYEIHQFYKDLVLETNTVLPSKPVWDAEDLSIQILNESDRHLAIAQLAFEIGNDFSIGISVYKLLKGSGQIEPKKVSFKYETGMDVDEEEHRVPPLKSELLYCQSYGEVSFTANEYKLINNPFGPPKFKLLGFKPASFLCKEKWYLKNCYFIFPNEKLTEGSTVAFKSMHQACINTNTIGICVMWARVNSKPNIVALLPCTRPLGLDIDIGFDVIPLPFKENVRDLSSLDTGETSDASDQQKHMLKNIVQSVKFDYIPSLFEDPKLQSLYRAIETKALDDDDDDVEPFIDTTKPKSKIFDEIDGEQFYELFGPFGVTAVKRSSNTKQVNTKLQKSVDLNELHETVQDRKVNIYTVAQLKEILKLKEATEALTGLKKNELVELVYKYCD